MTLCEVQQGDSWQATILLFAVNIWWAANSWWQSGLGMVGCFLMVCYSLNFRMRSHQPTIKSKPVVTKLQTCVSHSKPAQNNKASRNTHDEYRRAIYRNSETLIKRYRHSKLKWKGGSNVVKIDFFLSTVQKMHRGQPECLTCDKFYDQIHLHGLAVHFTWHNFTAGRKMAHT